MLTVHHLIYSRSRRILWLLEEIGHPYRIIPHLREPGFRPPASLRAVHETGKARVLLDAGLVMAESDFILDYLDEHYLARRFTPIGQFALLDHAEWMYFAETDTAAL